jgi:histidyl-tRNA synthetase
MKSQMKQADKSGAKVTLIVGESEAETNTVIVRSMADGAQRSVARDSLIEELKKEFK